MKRLKAAIIGLGNQAEKDHLPGMRESQLASLEAVCDIDKEKTERWSNKLSVPGFTDHKKALEEDIDFIIVAVQHDAYLPIIEDASKRGIHVLKEKPFARSTEEALQIKRTCEEGNIQLMTVLQRRFNPIYTTFFQLKEAIGNIFFSEMRYTLFVNEPHEGWRGSKKQAGGGCIIDMGYHMADMLIWYFGLPDKVHAEFTSSAKPEEQYDAEDTSVVMFSYDSGMFGSLMVSRYYPPKREQIKIVGDEGIIEIERGHIKRLRSDGSVAESLSREEGWTIAMTSQIDYFSRIILEGEENLGSPEKHLEHASFMEACYQSKDEEKYINPKEILEKCLES